MSRVSALPDTNIWRYIVDADAVEAVRKGAKAASIDLVACPAVVYECLRMSDVQLRRRLAKALTRQAWLRPMPEAYVEAEEVRGEITRLHPEWLVARPDTLNWHRNRSDWVNGFWRRVRHETDSMARTVATLGQETLDRARSEAKAERKTALDLGHKSDGLRFDTARAWYTQDVPGWDGEPFETWRALSEDNWWREVVLCQHPTMSDWLAPWLDLNRIRAERDRWVAFWTRECVKERLPREWLRWAMREVQALRKVTDGTPVDNQIATYLIDYTIFVTGDRAFADCVEVIRPHSPVPLAVTSTSPAGRGAVDHLLQLFDNVSAVLTRRT